MINEIELIFKCTRCGACCQGETTVSLDADDQARMIAHLGMSRQDIVDRYWRISGEVVQMQIHDGHCIFYENGCSVHQGRPWRCGQWPLHPAILRDISNYTAIADSCPGINKDLSYAEFCAILTKILAKTVQVSC